MVRNAGETDQCVHQASVRTQVVGICNLRAPPGRWEKETEKSQDASSGQARVVSMVTNRESVSNKVGGRPDTQGCPLAFPHVLYMCRPMPIHILTYKHYADTHTGISKEKDVLYSS